MCRGVFVRVVQELCGIPCISNVTLKHLTVNRKYFRKAEIPFKFSQCDFSASPMLCMIPLNLNLG